MHDEADIVLPALLAQVGIERPVLVGHSDGASIARCCSAGPVTARAVMAPHVFVEDMTVASITVARTEQYVV